MLRVEVFTDPGCPWAWSAEPARRRIEWLYGEQIAFVSRMVVLSETPDEAASKGVSTEGLAAGFKRLAARHGMPIDSRQRPRLYATLPACRAVVAACRHAPGRAEALLRSLRVRHFAHAEMLDDPEVIAAAARDAGLDPEDLGRWSDEPGTESAMREEMRDARSPLPAASALDHKLRGPATRRRYTCPTWILHREGRGTVVAPGFQPIEVYEVLIANLAPELTRREDPQSAVDVLRWARRPLAAAEIAAVLGVDLQAAERELERVAEEARGFWSIAPRLVRDGVAAGA